MNSKHLVTMIGKGRAIFHGIVHKVSCQNAVAPRTRLSRAVVCVLAGWLVGCGNAESQRTDQAENSRPLVPPTVSIEQYDGKTPIVDPIVEIQTSRDVATVKQTAEKPNSTTGVVRPKDAEEDYEVGSPLWLLSEISKLRIAPTDRVLSSSPVTDVEEVVLLSPQQQVEEEQRRNRKILQLAQEAVVKTHDDPDQLKLFNSALDALSEARLQLAISGDRQQAALLEKDASDLYDNDPTSFAAVESSFRVLRFAQSQAQKLAKEDSKWAVVYANQSRIFAERFPQEANRAAIHLVAAGKMCDHLRLHDVAKSCLTLIEEKFPETPYSQQIAGIQRRLRLVGQPIAEFSGSTLRGGHLSIQKFQGSPVLVVFWASNSEVFRHDLTQIQQTIAATGGQLKLLGVCLDRDEFQASRFAEESLGDAEHLFYSEHSKRGLKNVVADYYGVSKIPMYWLIDATGRVISIDLPIDQLDQSVQNLFELQPELGVSLK